MARKKKRVAIPDDVAAELQYASQRTCCVCAVPGLSFQIHHIDEDPSNNEPSNLALLCLQCHEHTQLSGGFGRKLNAATVRVHRDKWHERVRSRRAAADAIAAPTPKTLSVTVDAVLISPSSASPAAIYAARVPEIVTEVIRTAQSHWELGSTTEMREANAQVSNALTSVLVELGAFYPSGHFGDRGAAIYLDEQIAMRARWHADRLTPLGHDEHGTILPVMVGGAVIGDQLQMIDDMVTALCGEEEALDIHGWRQRLEKAQSTFGQTALD